MTEFDLERRTSESQPVEPQPPSAGFEIKGAELYGWNPEDKEQWERSGKKIAFRNLWFSIPSLLCAFAVWMCWGVLTVQMMSLGFPFSQEQLFTLTSIAGLSGATLRIPSTFFIRLCGGRNTIWFTTALLLIPVVGTALALQEPTTPLWVFQFMALLSGIGGGNFASSMSNISFYFPKAMQGLSLGLNAGLGNFGVTTMQILVPLAMTFGFAWQAPMILKSSSGTLLGKIPVGAESFIQNGSYVWLLILVPLFFTSWFAMNSISDESVSPNTGSALRCFGRISLMLLIGFLTSAAALWLMLPATANGAGISVNKWLILPCQIAVTVYLLKASRAERQARPPVQNIQQSSYLGDDRHIHHDVWIFYRLFGCATSVDQGNFRVLAPTRSRRNLYAYARQSQRSKRTAICLDRSVRRRAHSSCGGLAG